MDRARAREKGSVCGEDREDARWEVSMLWASLPGMGHGSSKFELYDLGQWEGYLTSLGLSYLIFKMGWLFSDLGT